MEQQQPRRLDHQTEKKGQKRKLEKEFEEEEDEEERDLSLSSPDAQQALANEVSAQVTTLNSTFSWREADRLSAKRAIHFLSELAKNEDIVNLVVDGGAVPALVRHLQEPPVLREEDAVQKPFEHEVEKGCAFALGLLAVKPEHQQLIVDAGALPHLVRLLKRQKVVPNSRAANGVIRRAADAITNLAHENSSIKTCVRIEGGIPPLVELLEYTDTKVQRAAAGALRTLAFKNDENKNQIVECNALPTLILMLRYEDAAIHYEAVGVIGNLVHSSPNIKREVLLAGALQPVIGLLSSSCSESQREAALLLGQFAATDSECKVHIVQRGAVRPLIEMLQSPDVQLREMSAFALGRLAQDSHNQAGIAHNGGLVPLLKLLDSKNGSLQHNAAFALYGLADNEDNVSDFIKVGGVQKLQDGEFIVQATKDCVSKTLKRLEEKIHGRVLSHLLYLMRVPDKIVQRRVALSLAHLCSPDDQRTIFIDNNGVDLLLGLLDSPHAKQQLDGSVALYKLANKASTLSPIDAAPPSPTPQVYLGEQYVNNSTLSDVTFLVEGRRFYAHRIALLASSDTFRAMFDGGYREKDARDIEIPNIRWEVFELMMRFIYTGSVNVTSDIAQDLLRAADQYLLEGLKRLCEYAIAQDISLENVSSMYELSEAFHAMSLRHTCILFILEQFDKLKDRSGISLMIQRIVPEIRNYFSRALTKPNQRVFRDVHAIPIQALFGNCSKETGTEVWGSEHELHRPKGISCCRASPTCSRLQRWPCRATCKDITISEIVPPALNDPETGVSSKDITISENVSARLYLPHLPNLDDHQHKLPVFVYFHGGGFCIESAFSFLDHRNLSRIAAEAKVIALSVEYRLAPEHPIPAAFDDAWEALQWVIANVKGENGCGNEEWLTKYASINSLFLGRDSAGGTMVHNVALRAGNKGLPHNAKIRVAYLGHPFFWGSTPIGSEPSMDPDQKALVERVWLFVKPSSNAGLDDPRINPMAPGAPSLDNFGCKSVLVCIAGKDVLLERGRMYEKVLTESTKWQGFVQMYESTDEEHAFHIYDHDSENAKALIKLLASFLNYNFEKNN